MTTETVNQSVINKGRKAVEKRAQQLQRMKVEYVGVNTVHPNKYNPNRQADQEFELLKASMREDGFTAPIVVQRATNEIIDGEHRWRAARDIGITEIPVVFTDMTPEQMRIATLRHNRAVGSEDVELAADVLKDLRELGAIDWAQEALGINDDELNKLLNDVGAAEALAGEEFTEAWVPTKNAVREDGTLQDARHERENVSFTPEASKLQTSVNAKLAEAKTDEERHAIEAVQKQESFRLIVVLNDADAELAKEVLGTSPAQKILEMCRRKIASKDAVQTSIYTG